MKKRLNQMVIIAILMLPFTAIMAQQRAEAPKGEGQREQMHRRNGAGIHAIPDLTDEQEAKIKEIHLAMMKESLPIKNQLGENHAKMKSLQTAENPDMKAIENLIDESSKLEASLKKKAAANHQEVRKILTDEQRVIFDSRSGQMGEQQNRPGAAGERGMNKRQRLHRDAGGK